MSTSGLKLVISLQKRTAHSVNPNAFPPPSTGIGIVNRSHPFVVIIILNWNNYEDTFECLKSLESLKYPNFITLIVDNGSSDNSTNRLNERFKAVSAIYLEANKGFGGGNNAGIRKALEQDADYVWLLNNDIIVSDDETLTELIETMDQHEDIGFLTPAVTHYPETSKMWFKHGFVNWKRASCGHSDEVDNKPETERNLLYNDYIPFCSGLIRRDVFDKIGYYPDDYYLYWGDVKYCTLARQQGYKIATRSDVEVQHKVTTSTDGSTSPTYVYYNARNRLLFSRDFNDNIPWTFVLYYFYDIISQSKGLIQTGDFSRIIPMFQGIIDGVLNKRYKGPYP